ncbi:MAG: hypothetical protein JWO69_194 [Thermoleophilia bacterium]|nr:hypothetical protein [Thermoleophilia bacterium]
MTRGTTLVQRAEGAAMGAASWVILVDLGFAWWWPIAVFLLFDLSALGYLKNPQLGAAGYNAVHSLVAPLLIGTAALLTGAEDAAFVALTWLIHIGVDRALGYGLKEPDSFSHTHLGRVGRDR